MTHSPLEPTEAVETSKIKLGEVVVNNDAFDLDLKINDGYQSYSAELLRLALVTLGGIGAVWLKLYLPQAHKPPPITGRMLILAFSSASVTAGAALFHRYTAADSLAYHLTALRRRARNRAQSDAHPADVRLATAQEKKRDQRFRWSHMLLRTAIVSLVLSILCFGGSLVALMR